MSIEIALTLAGLSLTIFGGIGAALYGRVTKTLDDTASKLGQVALTLARIEAGHGARLEALERGAA